MLTSRAIGEQLELLAEMLSLTAGDGVGVSWLPLSHDMGFFGVLLFTLAWDLDLVLSSPERFLTSPRTWIGDIADAGGTLTAGTSSALHVATRAQRSRRLARRLDLRAAIIGAERIDWTTLQRAVEVFGPFGLALENIMPAFGLAEATLAVTAVGLNESPSALALDAIALADGELVEVGGGAPHATSVVCLGRPCRDVRVAFAVPDRLSEMEVWSPSLASGYLGDPVLSAERFSNGGVRTGDLGFERDGKTYVVGRMDDMVSVRGRNVYTREIEASVDLLPDVRAGCSTIVDASDSQRTRLVMLVELKNGAGDTADIAAEAAGCAMRKAGIRLDECVFLEAGTLPKTPSGKIQRFRCRQLLTTEQMSVLARVVLSTAVTN
jgi:acyl-CoA synthetase (AMP-forming)/AMP-acid ligase II